MTLDVCTPLGWGKEIPPDFLSFRRAINVNHLIAQDIEDYRSGDWLARVAGMRTHLLELVEAPFWLSLDADTHLSTNALLGGLEWLMDRPGWGGLGFWTGEGEIPFRTGHVRLGAALYRTAATKGRVFRVHLDPEKPEYRCCDCSAFTQDLLNDGWGCDYSLTLRSEHRGD